MPEPAEKPSLHQIPSRGISGTITALLRNNLDGGMARRAWKLANVSAVPKGDRSEEFIVGSFRPHQHSR